MPLGILPNSLQPSSSSHFTHQPWLPPQSTSLRVSCISTRFRRKPGSRKPENSEAHELVRTLVKSFSDKEPLVKSLNKYVRTFRTEHCFLLFEELGKSDKWLQCLEISHCFLHLHYWLSILLGFSSSSMCILTIALQVLVYVCLLGCFIKFISLECVSCYNVSNYDRRDGTQVFRWMQKQRWYVADNGVYSKLISVMGKKRQTWMAMWLFSEMQNSGCRPDTSVYNAHISAHLNSKDKEKALEKALAYFNKMKGIERCQPNVVTYNVLLRAFAQSRNVEKVNSLFKDLDESIVSPDIYTYNGVMDAYGKNGMIRDMESVLSHMKTNQCKPDTITFNLLIDSYGKKQQFDKMEQVCKSLLRSKERPTLPTFNSMIINYGKARLKDEAEAVFKKMIDMKYSPSFITYESLIMMYGYCDSVSKGSDVIDGVAGSGQEMKVSTLNVMLDVYCRNGLPMEPDKLLLDASRIGIRPNVSTYKLLYKAYTEANMKELLDKLLKSMDKDGIVPNNRFFLEALGAFLSSTGSPESESASTDLSRRQENLGAAS